MSLLHEFIEEAGYLHCKISGSFDNIWNEIEFFGQLLLRSRCSGLSNILYDTRDMSGYPSATEQVIYMSGIVDQHDRHLGFAGKPLKIAYLGRKEIDQAYTPGLELAQSRGFAATGTASVEAAITWFANPAPKPGRNWQLDQPVGSRIGENQTRS